MSHDPLVLLGVLVGACLLGLAVHQVVFMVLRRAVARRPDSAAHSIVQHSAPPLRLLAVVVALDVAVAGVALGGALGTGLAHALGALITFGSAWWLVQLTYVLEDALLARFRLEDRDNLRARSVHTQIQVLRRVSVVVVGVVAVAIVLLSYGRIRAVGASLLASAGLVGLVAGLAARPLITNVLAGLQIAISQPIRVDDVVVIDGHWGRVEEIALTYVVVRVWNLRRLVLPISYLLENPFENWTRSTADIVGWVHLEVDYATPVEAVRAHLHQVLEASPRWDGKIWSLQVTGSGTETIQLRALMSAADSATSWDLQCEVRERLIDFLRREHPDALPRLRTEPALDSDHKS